MAGVAAGVQDGSSQGEVGQQGGGQVDPIQCPHHRLQPLEVVTIVTIVTVVTVVTVVAVGAVVAVVTELTVVQLILLDDSRFKIVRS